MNIILLEANRYPIGSFLDRVKKPYPKSSVVYCTSTNLTEIYKKVSSPPPFSEGWLVIATLRNLTEDIVTKLDSQKNVIVYVVRSPEDLHKYSVIFEIANIEYKVVDNYHIDKEVIIDYVQEELNIPRDIAKYVVNRHRGILSKVVESVEVLRNLTTINRKVIRDYTEASADLSFDGLFDYIIGYNNKHPHKKAVKLIHRYRFGIDFLMKFIVRRFKSYLSVFDLVKSGIVSMENYKSYFEENRTQFKDLTEFSFYKAVDAYKSVSYDKLIYLYYLYRRELESGPKVIRVLALLRLSK